MKRHHPYSLFFERSEEGKRTIDDIRRRAVDSMKINSKIKTDRENLKKKRDDCCYEKCSDQYQKLSDLKDVSLYLQNILSDFEKKIKENGMNMTKDNKMMKDKYLQEIEKINNERDSLKIEIRKLCNINCISEIQALKKFDSETPTEREKIFKGVTERRLKSESDNRNHKRMTNAANILVEGYHQGYYDDAKRANIGGKIKVYTGPKNGKYIIKNGSKVYIDRKSLSNNLQYRKGKVK